MATFAIAPAHRQVVILQVSDSAQGIVWQRYYYGGSSTGGRACNARAISVWPGVDELSTRIAICGETYDQFLPLAQANHTSATATSPTGFIAVFNGSGTLLYSHHAFGQMIERSCAITDVSIRIEGVGSQQRDVVTYCGISTHELGGAWLASVKPFASFNGSSSGSTVQSTVVGQWDGFVGRISRTPTTHTVEFHSSVSGPDQDGLFGLAEIDDDRFVVVGATELLSTAAAPAGFAFPGFTNLIGSHYLGVLMIFDAAPTRIGGNLKLENVEFMGDLGTGSAAHSFTIARDVLVRNDWLLGSPSSQLLVVAGSTNSATALDLFARNNVFHGGTDGFVAAFWDDRRVPATPLLSRFSARFFGGEGNDGFVGIQGWNEYDDHVVAAGFVEQEGAAATDIVAASYFTDSHPGSMSLDIEPIGEARIGGAASERPAVMGGTNATNALALTPFATGPLGDSAGGGIAVDERARVQVVGSTSGSDFPPQAGGRPYDAGNDAVRVVFDMLQPGVGRTDGTGVQGGFVLPSGFTGGTTPACALQPFGRLIGQPLPSVRRVLIDYMGSAPATGVTGASILVTRPTAALGQAGIVLAGFQYGFPGAGTSSPPVPPVMLASGLEMYTTDNPYIYVAGVGMPFQAYIEPLAPLPSPPTLGMPMTVQMFFYVPSMVPAGIGSPCTSTTEFTATPALWMNL